MLNKKNKGFTLAEVLISLVIIGVIAAMTIPTLINKTDNQEIVSKLKKTYSTIAQITNSVIAENGSPNNWATNQENVYNLYKKYMQITKDCGTSSGCFWPGIYKYLNNSNDINIDSRANMNKVLLQDGTQVAFANLYDCKTTVFGSNNVCLVFDIDLNGNKGPNKWGRDLFMFVIKSDRLEPAGCDADGYCTKNSTGWGCACKVIRDGAINY